MKNLFSATLLCLFACVAHGQGISYQGGTTQTNVVRGGIGADSFLFMPRWTPKDWPYYNLTGAIRYNPLTGKMQYHNATVWVTVGDSTSGGGGTYTNGYGLNLAANQFSVDTSAGGLRTVANSYSKADADGLFYPRNSNPADYATVSQLANALLLKAAYSDTTTVIASVNRVNDTANSLRSYAAGLFASVPTYTAGTGIGISSNVISNTGVLSVNGATGAITNVLVSGGNNLTNGGVGTTANSDFYLIANNRNVVKINGSTTTAVLNVGPDDNSSTMPELRFNSSSASAAHGFKITGYRGGTMNFQFAVNGTSPQILTDNPFLFRTLAGLTGITLTPAGAGTFNSTLSVATLGAGAVTDNAVVQTAGTGIMKTLPISSIISKVKGTGTGNGSATSFTVTCPGMTTNSIPVVGAETGTPSNFSWKPTATNTLTITYTVAPANAAALVWFIHY